MEPVLTPHKIPKYCEEDCTLFEKSYLSRAAIFQKVLFNSIANFQGYNFYLSAVFNDPVRSEKKWNFTYLNSLLRSFPTLCIS